MFHLWFLPHNCSCHRCCPAELVDPHVGLLGWTMRGEAGLHGDPEYWHCWYQSLSVSAGSRLVVARLWTGVHWPCSIRATCWTSSLVFLMQTESPNVPFTDWVTFPAVLTSVFTFLNKTLNLFYCLLRGRKKHLWLLHTYFKRRSLPFTQTRAFPMRAVTSISLPGHTYFGPAEKEEPYLSFRTSHTSCCCVFLLLSKGNTLSFSHSLAFSSQSH